MSDTVIISLLPDIFLAVLVGLVLGSFATMLVYRLPRDLPIGRLRTKKSAGGDNPNRSRCPTCHHELGFRDLVPVFSWLFQKGKCRHCHAAIGMNYLLVELACLVSCLALYGYIGYLGISLFILWAVVPVLVAMIFIDWHYQILPDVLNATLGILGLVYHGMRIFMDTTSNDMIQLYLPEFDQFWIGLGGFLLSGLVYAGFAWLLRYFFLVVRKKEALGMGDVKFFMAAGIWLGAESMPWFLLLSGVLGIVFGVVYRLVTKQQRFPFGPALIAALAVSFIFPVSF